MALRVEDLRVYYRTLAGDVKALDGVTFDVADGEAHCSRSLGLKTSSSPTFIT
jgi:hypothetical protein